MARRRRTGRPRTTYPQRLTGRRPQPRPRSDGADWWIALAGSLTSLLRPLALRSTLVVATTLLTLTATAGLLVSASSGDAKRAATCLGHKVTRKGTNGPDTITGTNHHDVIDSFGGNDHINGLGG